MLDASHASDEARMLDRMSHVAISPPPFVTPDGRSVAFVKFRWSNHDIVIDSRSGTVTARSTICFDQFLDGSPVIDLAVGEGSILSSAINGNPVDWVEVFSPPSDRFPDGGVPITTYRVLDRRLSPGRYYFTSSHLVAGGFQFPARGLVDGYLEMSDHEERSGHGGRPFLERYLPSNLEFDRHPSVWHVSIVGAAAPHSLFSNGSTTGDGGFRWSIAFPDNFSSSSPFLRILPRGESDVRTFFAHPPGPKAIRVDVISSRSGVGDSIDDFEAPVRLLLTDLHKRFGPFPFDRLLIASAENHLLPMEYCGAVVSSISTLGHELAHCYVGRSVAPIDGDAGWIDEGFASWYSEGSNPNPGPLPVPNDAYMGALSPYRRFTDPSAWEGLGGGVIAVLDHLLANKGGMSRFVNALIAQVPFVSLSSHEFQRRVEQFGGRSFGPEVFDPYVYRLPT
jgi:hypothetical protein